MSPSLWEPYKGRFSESVTRVNGECFVPRSCRSEQTFDGEARNSRSMPENRTRKAARGPAVGAADLTPGPDRPHLDERGSAVSIMLPPDSKKANWSERGWRANDLTPADVAPLAEKFAAGFAPGEPADCWLWSGYRLNTGYGGVSRSGSLGPLLAHRVAWVLATGESLTQQLTIDHLCNVRLCVNPAHLEPVTMQENYRRMSARRGWMSRAEAAEIVACDHCGTTMRRSSIPRHHRRLHVGAR